MTGAETPQEGAPLLRVVNADATPEEVAALSLFLASDESRYITGEVHTISGGMYYKA